MIDEILTRMCTFYQRSPKRLRELKTVGKTLGVSVVKPAKSEGTRWIDHKRKALTTMDRNYAAIITHLEDIASGERDDIKADDVAKVKGYLKVMKTHKFVMYAAMYRDIVKQLAILSMCFQSDTNSVNEVQIDVEVTLSQIEKLKKEDPEVNSHLKAFQEEVKLNEDDQTFCLFRDHSLPSSSLLKATFLKDSLKVLSAVQGCLNKRFSNFIHSEILNTMKVIDPSNWPIKREELDSYGNAEIGKFMQHFDIVLKANDCDKDKILAEWQKLKIDIKSNHKKLKYNDVWECIISQKSERYSNVLHVVKIILAVPISTSHVERLFSGVKRILGE